MESQEIDALPLIPEYFEVLFDLLKQTFKEKHRLLELPKSMQFYGYGNFRPEHPNLKCDLEEISNDFINGKYLYDKERDFHKGKPIIKLNSYYKAIVLQYVQIDSFESFFKSFQLDPEKEKQQHSLLYHTRAQKTYYYLNYYFGEDDVIYKGETVISNNWKKIKHTYVYPQEDGTFKEHYNFGKIVRREDTLHINSKTLLDGRLVEGGRETYYIGHDDPSNVKFLIGTYCTFDIYTNTVAGQSILEKCESKEDMEERAKSPEIPPYIAIEIRNKRIVNKSVVPRHHLEISNNSPYASIFKSLAGNYKLTMQFSEGRNPEYLSFEVLPTNYKILPKTENVYIEEDRMELLNKGSVVHFWFNFAGILAFDQLDIYFKTYYLKPGTEVQQGVFSGIDNENRLVKGTVEIKFESCS